MTLKKTHIEVLKAKQRLVGKYCHSCQKSRPLEMFDIIPKKSITKCRECAKRYGAKK